MIKISVKVNFRTAHGDSKAMEKRKPLKIEDSWAISPKLIPEESRILDQPELRVPIRRKAGAAPAKK